MIQTNQNKKFARLIPGAIFIVILSIVFFSCRTIKSFEAETKSSSTKDNSYYDSIRTQDSIRISTHYEELLKEMNSDVSFYKGNQGTLIDALDQLRDSLQARGALTEEMKRKINRVLDSMQVLCNAKVKVNKDGSYEISGPISNLNLQLKEMKKKFDSVLAENKTQAKVETDKVKETETSTATVSQTVKKGWPWYIWLLIGAALAHAYRLIPIVKKVLT